MLVALSQHKEKRAIETIEAVSEGLYRQDAYLSRILAVLYLRNDQVNLARNIISKLHNSNGIDFWLKAMIKFHDKDYSGCRVMCTQALYSEPRLVFTSDFLSFKKQNPSLSDSIIKTINREIHPMNAIEKSHYGSLLYYLGFHKDAIPHLKESISQYPTLRMPYLLLGDTCSYRFLLCGISQPYDSQTFISQQPDNLIDIILSEYQKRLWYWYSIHPKFILSQP